MTSDAVAIFIGLIGGLALFLFGMEQMSNALQKVAGPALKNLLGRLTRNRFVGAVTGAAVTAVIQSSSVTTVLVVGFISAGLMTLPQSIAVVMGANIGTTITAQIIAFKITQYSLIAVAAGFGLQFLSRNPRIKLWGDVVMGLGLIFFGMQLMSDATGPLRTYQPFVDWMSNMESPALGILAAATFTAVVQSSSATTGVIIVLAGQGFISIEAGIALVFGSNIGTCVTALLAAIGKERAAIQAALVHVLFNVAGVLIWLPFIDQLAQLTAAISPHAEGLYGIERMAAEVPRQIANVHTVFNVANTLIFIWLVTPFGWLVGKLLPDRPRPEEELGKPRFLDEMLLQNAPLALDRSRLEIGRLGQLALRMVEDIPDAIEGGWEELGRLKKMDDAVDELHRAIIRYLSELSRRSLLEGESAELSQHLAIANYLEGVGDLVQTNLADSVEDLAEVSDVPSSGTKELLWSLHVKVAWAVAQAVRAFVYDDKSLAAAVIDAKVTVNGLVDELEHHLAVRLVADEPHRIEAFRRESEIVQNLKRVYYLAKRVAKEVAESNATTNHGTLS